MKEHIQKIQMEMKQLGLHAIILKSKENKRYVRALTGSGVKVLITLDAAYQIMDGRYENEAIEKTKGFINIVHLQHENFMSFVMQYIPKDSKVGLEASVTTWKDLQFYQTFSLEYMECDQMLLQLRSQKSLDEIQCIKQACSITDEVFQEVLPCIKIGMSEHEISALIQYYAMRKGVNEMAFQTIVVSGKQGAFPHGRATSKKIQSHEFITIDFGVCYQGYQSDMTRTICIQEPTPKMKEVYQIVKEAQQLGIHHIQEGQVASNVDNIVRNYIVERGYGNYFTHGLGHGIGLGNGELPLLNKKCQMELRNHMVMSCEPGIYIPNEFGVRIEDDVLIEDGNAVVLNQTTKELIILEG